MKGCRFCDLLLENSFDIFYQDDDFYVALDNCPKMPGHFLVVPKRHVLSVDELSDSEFLGFRKVSRDVLSMFAGFDFVTRYEIFLRMAREEDSKLIKRCQGAIDFFSRENSKISPVGFSWGLNEGKMSGQEYEHLHMHVLPAYSGNGNRRGYRGSFFFK
jgi:diadenosine tetraphosphate (Ap4A) HIT family hydrolase